LSFAHSFEVGSFTNAIETEPSTWLRLDATRAIFMMSGEIETDVT
jgi:hypothetical protein